ncbi:hypothetical protein HMN09_01076200 [Mycena chlorophos]|uniref:F-box domain-containing protein n=1 Tax=Mycena chlorophos TaxID=658473 RepID=A0A8H6SC35_MYCCL|nr:hypothetical protein HMN09_01076200 [Mycena chlorophos]
MSPPRLPPELVQLISNNVEDRTTFFTLRLVSQTLNSLAIPRAFAVLSVQDTPEHGNALCALQNCEERITSSVRKVIFEGESTSWHFQRDRPEEERSREAVTGAFSGLTKFPNLEELILNFDDTWWEGKYTMEEPDEPSHYLYLQLGILEALAQNPHPALVSLSLHNLIAIPNDVFSKLHFPGLKTLSLSAITNVNLSRMFTSGTLGFFWQTTIPQIIQSAGESLTSLTIASDLNIGAVSGPAMDFGFEEDDGLFLPHLAHLALENFVFEPSGETGDPALWIVRHKPTLRRLELRNCTIDGGEEMYYERRWDAVFKLFEEELEQLREFVFSNPSDEGVPFVYTYVDPSWGYASVDDPEDRNEEDDGIALRSLLAVVEARNE